MYGFVFSLLDASWRPFSLTGVTLFLTMTAAFGLVGLADDIVQWLAARRWKLGPGLNMRLGSLLLIVASAAFSRGLSLTPGIMFGAPEVFELLPTELQARKKNTLLRLAAATLLLILVGAWLLTVPSALMLRGVTGHVLFMTLVSGVQGFLLLVFAVTVQNVFLQMLNMPGTIGEALRRWSWLAWAFGLLLATFTFLHTLLNPRGDLARALQNTNIRYFFITIGLFLAFALLTNLFFQVRKAMAPQPVMEAQARWARLQRMGCCLGLLVILLLCMCLAVASVYQVVRAGWLSSL